MDINATIAHLGAELDKWFDGNRETFASNDRSAQTAALQRALAIDQKIEQIKTKGLVSLAAVLKGNEASPQDRVTSLVSGIRFGARLSHTLHDELLDTTGENQVVSLMHDIVHELDAIDPGRTALVPLLDDPDPGVRAYAGAYLIKLMPDRVVPILRDIEEKEDANSAHFTALWARVIWERGHEQAAGKK